MNFRKAIFASPLDRDCRHAAVGRRCGFAADMKSEELVAEHLDSIGKAESRAGAKSRIVQGTSLFKIPSEAAVNSRARARWFPRDGSPS